MLAHPTSIGHSDGTPADAARQSVHTSTLPKWGLRGSSVVWRRPTGAILGWIRTQELSARLMGCSPSWPLQVDPKQARAGFMQQVLLFSEVTNANGWRKVLFVYAW